MRLQMRAVGPGDEPLLRRIYAGTRAAELSLTDWDADARERFVDMQFHAQRRHYDLHWPAARHQIICAESGGQWHDVGRLWVDCRPEALHVLDIALLPDWCGQGIGSCCLQGLFDEALRDGLDVSIQVELDNPARRLYDRLGFQPVGDPQGLHQRMVRVCEPAPAAVESCDEQT